MANAVCGNGPNSSGLTGLCGLANSPNSPAAIAMVPGSPQLASLAPLPSAIPLYAVAGNIQLQTKASLIHTKVDIPVQIGDFLVLPASALAEADHTGTGSGHFQADCDLSVSQLTSGQANGYGSCTHGALLYDPAVTAAVTADVKAFLAG